MIPFAYLVASAASIFYGSADFAGGIAARRGHAAAVTALSGVGAIVVLLAGMLVTRGAPTPGDFAWAAATGVAGAAGATLIYYALALGPVTVASPVLCITALALPVIVGVVLGERPGPLAWAGVALAVLAIPLLAQTGIHPDAPSRGHVRRTLWFALLAGLAAGTFLVGLSRIGRDAGLLPLVVTRGVSIAILVAITAMMRRPLLPPRPARGMALAAGALDSVANVAFWFAVQGGRLALVSAIVSLAPATTVLLARATLRERWTAAQTWGLGVALAAGVCISLG